MKVLFVASRYDPTDHNAGSGVDYDLYHGLLRNGAEVHLVGPFPYRPALHERVFRRVHSILFKRRPAKYPISFLFRATRGVMEAVKNVQPDVIFSKYAAILCRLKTDVPIVCFADTTLAGSQREWPLYTWLAYLRQNRWEKITYHAAKKIITQSQWSADLLVSHYHQPVDKIHILPAPASLPEDISPEEYTRKNLDPLKILLVGRDFDRKGVDVAMDVVHQLNHEGVPAILRVVGLEGESTPYVEFMGLYNKTRQEELQGYIDHYRWANFLIHPAIFEAAGIVPSEAAAFGVPTLTNDVGGLATTVADGVSGIVLPKHSPPEVYVQAVKQFIKQPEKYYQLCEFSMKRYEEELNWGVASQRVFRIVSEAAGNY